jgi:hypothetical protein
MPDMPMHPSPMGKTVGPTAPNFRSLAVITMERSYAVAFVS